MNISINLDEDFSTEFSNLCTIFGEKLAELNGLGKKQLNYTDFIDNFIDKSVVADASIDSNANVGHKDIVSLENEMAKPHSKLLAFNKIFYELKKKYGLQTAQAWLSNEWRGYFYLHDAYNSSMKSYCYSGSLEDIATKGLFFIDNFNAQPPKHLTTFTDFVVEYVSYCSNRTSGGCGIADFLIYSFYFWDKDGRGDYLRDQEFQRIIYKLNQPYLRGGIQSSFTTLSIFDREYLAALFGGKSFPDGSLIIDKIEDLIEYQKAFMRVLSETRTQNMMTFPVMTYALLWQDGHFADEEFARWCCEHNMKWCDSNFFVSEDVTSLSSCCRLSNNIKDLGYFNSIGSSALEVGSVKVNTLNLARIAYDNPKEKYLDALSVKTELCLKALDVIRHIIQRNIEKGLLPNFSNGLVKMNKLYNTCGINGLYECLHHYGFTETDAFGYTKYTPEGIAFAEEIILATIHKVIDDFPKDYMINIEQIPGERAAYILEEKDKIFYPNEEYPLPLYGNQWIPLGVKCTIQDKVEISAALDKACSGGSVAHINIDEPFRDFDTAWKFLNYIAGAGVPYFAFNTRISACKHNHGFYGEICPVCGERKVTTYQRVVGFLTPTKTYSQPRKEEFYMRDWFSLNES